MLENSDCRLCLKTSKRLNSLDDSKNGVSYWHMIQSISDIKRSGTDEKACVSCCRKLIEAYNFKLLIESSNNSLRNTNTSKRINFNNIDDIQIEIPDDRLESLMKESILDNFQADVEQFNYNDTVIRRVAESDRKPFLVEFFNSIKEQPDDEDFGADMDNNENNVPDDENYYPDDGDVKEDLLIPLYSIKTRNNQYENPNPEDTDDYDLPLSRRKTRNNVYEPIQPRITRKSKKLRSDDEHDEDYVPNRQKQPNKQLANKNECKRPKGRPRHGRALPVPIIPKVLDNIRISYNKIVRKREKSQICHHCGKLCAHIDSHLLLHSDERKYKCEKCSKSFTTLSILTNHRKTHQSKTIKCDLCVATFSNNGAYQSHKKSHTVEKNFACELCSKAFKSTYRLKRHKLHMHNIGLKEFKCDTCEKVCKSRDVLKHHFRVHTGERPYNCEICSQPYSYKHDFNRHCLKKHGVLFDRRSVYVMNEEVLVKERALMRDLMLRMNGVVKEDLPENPFDGPQGYLAYQKMIKYLQTQQLPVDFQL